MNNFSTILKKVDGILITDKYVFFYNGPLSNFAKTSFIYEAFNECHRFFSSEQAFMWHKAMHFNDIEVANFILNENENPKECKRLGRLVKNYDDKAWDNIRYSVFQAVLYAKFTQDPEMTKYILQDKFEGKTFVEASPFDGIWGIKMSMDDPKIIDEKNWNGKNLLGKCLTSLRPIIKFENNRNNIMSKISEIVGDPHYNKNTFKSYPEKDFNEQTNKNEYDYKKVNLKTNTDTVIKVIKGDKDMVNHPSHYQSKSGLEVIDIIEAFDLNFNLGNVVKYILRCGKKDSEIQELEKAKWYLEREIENRKNGK